MANKSKKKVAKNPAEQINVPNETISNNTTKHGVVKFLSKVFAFVECDGGLVRIDKPAGDIKVGDKIEF